MKKMTTILQYIWEPSNHPLMGVKLKKTITVYFKIKKVYGSPLRAF
jgi:hypothetical protein